MHPLSGQQRKKLRDALIDAFPDQSSLEQMLSFELNKNLNAISGGANLKEVVFELIKIAEAENWIKDLIYGARESNPGNQSLQDIAAELFKISDELDEAEYERKFWAKYKPMLEAKDQKIKFYNVVPKAVDQLESNPTLKTKEINVLKAGGVEAFKEAIDHLLVNILMATIEGWREVEPE